MAITSLFSNGILTEFGDAQDNTIVTGREAAGNILVNDGAVAILGGPATVANTRLIQVFGQAAPKCRSTTGWSICHPAWR